MTVRRLSAIKTPYLTFDAAQSPQMTTGRNSKSHVVWGYDYRFRGGMFHPGISGSSSPTNRAVELSGFMTFDGV